MPLYTYTCDDHGSFTEWASMSESDAPCACPSCAAPAPRALARPALGGRTDGAAEGADAARPASFGGCGCSAASCMH